MDFCGGDAEIREHSDKRRFVTIYLDTGYSMEMFNNILGFKNGFDRHVKDHWQLLLPYEGNKDDYKPTKETKDFGYNFTYEIIEKSEIRTNTLPGLLIINYGATEDVFISFSDLDKDGVRRMIEDIGDIILTQTVDGPKNEREFRIHVTNLVVRNDRIRRFISLAKGNIGNVASIITKIPTMF